MKKKMMVLLVVIGVVCVGTVYFGISFFNNSAEDKMLNLEKPDYIKLYIDGQEYVLEKNTKD